LLESLKLLSATTQLEVFRNVAEVLLNGILRTILSDSSYSVVEKKDDVLEVSLDLDAQWGDDSESAVINFDKVSKSKKTLCSLFSLK
jgi:hypothetical protein